MCSRAHLEYSYFFTSKASKLTYIYQNICIYIYAHERLSSGSGRAGGAPASQVELSPSSEAPEAPSPKVLYAALRLEMLDGKSKRLDGEEEEGTRRSREEEYGRWSSKDKSSSKSAAPLHMLHAESVRTHI